MPAPTLVNAKPPAVKVPPNIISPLPPIVLAAPNVITAVALVAGVPELLISAPVPPTPPPLIVIGSAKVV